MEQIIETKSFEQAVLTLDRLMVQSGRFVLGSILSICGLEASYALGKKNGCMSLDHQIWYRIDYDEDKGPHFNYEDFSIKSDPIKYCI